MPYLFHSMLAVGIIIGSGSAALAQPPDVRSLQQYVNSRSMADAIVNLHPDLRSCLRRTLLLGTLDAASKPLAVLQHCANIGQTDQN